jgi:hypothetical protein
VITASITLMPMHLSREIVGTETGTQRRIANIDAEMRRIESLLGACQRWAGVSHGNRDASSGSQSGREFGKFRWWS